MAQICGADVDEEGFLVNLKDWTREIAIEMGKADEIDLENEETELYSERWEVLNLLRDYFEEYQIAPAVRVLTKAVGKKLGKDKGNSKYLYTLFPYGPGKQGCKFAGLPKPTGCI
ncbi:MAG: TusE/DsrC/DsvC family sulfur relay protein [Candidatus Thioglobus sp.]|jgi:tRNA 2-thiouridine synthesizing protein E|uniref:TusE/DsrC/DsvC family sulfur relay protein n=1 Tax=Candidatus Thioglobus sp. TaxID=2026721 RepID=UPI0030A4426C